MFQRNYIAGWNVNYRFEILLTRLILVFTAIAAIMLLRQQLMEIGWKVAMVGDWSGVGSQCIYVIVIILLIYGNFVYKLTRLGYLQRRRDHEPASRNALELVYSGAAAPLAVLVPSYHEEIAVVRRTLLSAALQEYPERHIILLIDDAYNPQTLADTANLEAMRELPRALQQLFDAPARHFEQAYRGYLNRRACSSANEQSEAALLAQLYSEAADWLEKQIAMYFVQDHGDALLINELMEPCKNAHRARAEWLASLADIDGLKSAIVLHEYRRLATLFRVEFASFERKRYENLSHQPNKAMNLNSYIEIMGKSFREVPTADGKGLILAQVPPAQGALHIPDAVFVLTLDADSLLAPDYALRMVHIMNQSGNERIAIAQTPYSTIPGAPGILERIAGATTDIQYLIHQGFTKHNATFWVGANALLRKAALEDIHTEAIERGYRVTKYIQDRTVIEDTESTMDLVRRGWTLYNYPERLAYSATPADFGSLLIQRRRWANGGLIILPKALRYLFRGPITWWKIAEGFFRVHYLSSIAAVNIGLLVIPFCSSEPKIFRFW